MAEWKALELPIASDIAPLIGDANTGIGIASAAISTAVTVLENLASFVPEKPNLVYQAVQALLAQVEELIQSFRSAGVNTLSLAPESLADLLNYQGGYPRIQQTILASINDVNDPNRPQYGPNESAGGLILLITAENAANFLEALLELFSFFTVPLEIKYPIPQNLRVVPADPLGIPIGDSINLFGFDPPEPSTLRLEWEEPRYANDVLLDIFGANKFYIERSKSRNGLIEMEVPDLSKLSPRQRKLELTEIATEKRDADGKLIFHWEPVNPQDPFVNFMDLADIADNRVNFLSGQYAYILRDVEKGDAGAYYYRVRSVPRNTRFGTRQALVRDSQGQVFEATVYDLLREGQPIAESCPPSIPVYGRLPNLDNSFDLPTALLNVIRAAYLLRFDTEVNDSAARLLTGSKTLKPKINDSLYQEIGAPIYFFEKRQQDGSLTEEQVYYWTEPLFDGVEPLSFNDMRDSIQSALVIDAGVFDPFGGVDEFIAPRLNLTGSERLRLDIDRKANTLIKKLVPRLVGNEALLERFQSLYVQNEQELTDFLTQVTLDSDFTGSFRGVVDSLLGFASAGISEGAPPNWESAQLVSDYIPALGLALDKLDEVVGALSAASQSTTQRFQENLTGLADRLENLNLLIELVDETLAVLERFANLGSGSIETLWIPPGTGGAGYLQRAIREATEKPDFPTDAFVGGLMFAFGGPDPAAVQSVATTFNLIFGD